MYSSLSQQTIGSRLSSLRKQKGLSQDDLAKRLNMSRPSLAQIELGNRSVSILEMHTLARILGFSLDEFMSDDFLELNEPIAYYSKQSSAKTERISSTLTNMEKLTHVFLYLLERCAGKPNVGETVLYKLLYFADFNYYEQYETHLTGSTYRKLPFGPVPQRLDVLINQLIAEGKLQRIHTTYHGYPQTRYLPLKKADLTQLLASEKETIDRVIEQMSDWSASTISAYSHLDMPWKATKEGEDIDYELVFYREAPFSVRCYDEDIAE